jgi:hypothetical protein
METPSAENVGTIVQWVGATDTYTNGYFYKCTAQGTTPETYAWENVSVGAGGVTASYDATTKKITFA